MFSHSMFGATLLFLLSSRSYANSWVEQLDVLTPSGVVTGKPGYPCGNGKRNPPLSMAEDLSTDQ